MLLATERRFLPAERLADLQRLVRQRTYDDPRVFASCASAHTTDPRVFDSEQTGDTLSLIFNIGSPTSGVVPECTSGVSPNPGARSRTAARSGEIQ